LYDGPSEYANLVTPGLNGQKKRLQKFGLRNVGYCPPRRSSWRRERIIKVKLLGREMN